MEKLRSQYGQATRAGGVETWYLVLCTDERAHRDALRQVRSEFAEYDRVKIIDSVEAPSFYRMSTLELDTAVTRRLCANDLVLRAATKSLNELPFRAGPIALALACRGLAGETHIDDETMYEIVVPYAEQHGVDAADLLGALVSRRYEALGGAASVAEEGDED